MSAGELDGHGSACAAWPDALTAEEWWAEWESNACCPSSWVARQRDCGCGGSAAAPTGISRLLTRGEL